MHKVILAIAATTLAAASFALAPAAYAGHDRTVKIIERTDGTILVPGTYTTVESAPGTTILREESAVVSTPVTTTRTVIKEKKKRHHLLKLPFISVF
ncbi:MAG: hypothetical protein U0105_01830 [Candidatus Obscuribacterales bacterium]